jgi:hypothetical protein
MFRFKPWRSYQSFHFLEGTSLKAFVLQTCCVHDCVAECSTTENCYLLLTVRGREQDISEDEVTALWVVTLHSDVGYPPHCYMLLQYRRLWLENLSTWKPWISCQWCSSFSREILVSGPKGEFVQGHRCSRKKNFSVLWCLVLSYKLSNILEIFRNVLYSNVLL